MIFDVRIQTFILISIEGSAGTLIQIMLLFFSSILDLLL